MECVSSNSKQRTSHVMFTCDPLPGNNGLILNLSLLLSSLTQRNYKRSHDWRLFNFMSAILFPSSMVSNSLGAVIPLFCTLENTAHIIQSLCFLPPGFLLLCGVGTWHVMVTMNYRLEGNGKSAALTYFKGLSESLRTITENYVKNFIIITVPGNTKWGSWTASSNHEAMFGIHK
jgi:hypothetical protein